MRTWSITEVDIIKRELKRGKGDRQIAESLCKWGYPRSVFETGERVRLLQNLPANHEDLAFKRALLTAIKSGREQATVGIVKDQRPLRASVFQAEPRSSGCSSAAAQCAEG